jgi:hypothetical protein
MKTYIRLSLIAFALCLSLAACKGKYSGSSADSSKVDSRSTTKIDSTVKPDTSKKDSAAMGTDTSKKKVDTIRKTTVKTTVKKKTSKKKDS